METGRLALTLAKVGEHPGEKPVSDVARCPWQKGWYVTFARVPEEAGRLALTLAKVRGHPGKKPVSDVGSHP
jgi:hypothetical protein